MAELIHGPLTIYIKQSAKPFIDIIYFYPGNNVLKLILFPSDRWQ